MRYFHLLKLFLMILTVVFTEIFFFSNPAFGKKFLVFGIKPQADLTDAYERFLPLKRYLETRLNIPIKIKVARDFQEAVDELGKGYTDFAYLNPAAYVEAHNKYQVKPLVKAVIKGTATYRSVIVAKRDSDIKKIIDITYKSFAFGAQYSSSGFLMPFEMMKLAGLGLSDLKGYDFLMNEDSVALSVLNGSYDAGGLRESVAK